MKKILSFLILLSLSSQIFAQSVFDNMNSWVGNQMAGSTGAGSYIFLFLGGMLASLLPCVYPVYPLTINFLRNRKSRLGRFAHPIAYYLGLVLIYFIFGIIASLTGGAFNEILRLPSANLIIGVLLFIMTLATVDYLHLPFFGGQLDTENQGLGGSILMGVGAGLLSSACVGPIVVSILLAIASGASGISIGLTITAAIKMMLFGLGVGIPLLMLGVFGLTLPKSGKWMVYVQWIFAALIAYFAFGYLQKAFSGFGFTEKQGILILSGSVLILFSAFHLQGKERPKHSKTNTSLFVLGGIIGFFLLFANILPQYNSAQASSSLPAPQNTESEQQGNLIWQLTKESAYEKAALSGKMVFIDFHGDWCTNCKAFQKKTQDDEELNKALQKAVLYKVYDTSPEFKEYRDDPRFPELKIGLPFFIITDSRGNLVYKTNDMTRTNEMILFLN